MTRCLTLLATMAVAMASVPVAPAAAQPAAADTQPRALAVPRALHKEGVRRFQFTQWAGPDFPVWVLKPRGAGADAPVLFVMHGVRRDADRYIGEWVAIAKAEKMVIVVPEFTAEAFPGGRLYNQGGLFDADGKPRPRDQWAFAAIDPIFDAVKQQAGLTAARFNLYGHSAGAQFVHRFVVTGGSPRLDRAISANAGSYAFPTMDVAWPFGMGGLPDGLWQPETVFAQPLLILLGTADNDPDYPSLPRQPQAMKQGPHRLARGLAFYAAAKDQPGTQWACALAPGIGHDNGRMAPFALSVLKNPGLVKAGAPCAPVPAAPVPPVTP